MAVPIPLSASNVRIFSNVRFTRDYSHVRYFATESEQTTYFNSRTVVELKNNVSFVKHDLYSGLYKCPRNIETLRNATYMSFENEGQTYYAFIDNMEYVNDGNTSIYFTIDYYQTFLFRLTFFQSHIEREHTARYSGNMPIVNTINEGLDFGELYDVKSIERIQAYDGIQFMVMVCKRDFHNDGDNEIKPTYNGIPQGLSYYIHPFFENGETPTVNVGGATVTMSSLDTVLACMFNQLNTVENVVALYITDNPGLNIVKSGSTLTFNVGQIEHVDFVYDDTHGFTLHLKNATQYTSYIKDLGNKYTGVSNIPESKLMMYPYTVYVLTDLKGNQIEIKPEYIKGNNLRIRMQGSMGVVNKTAYQILDYTVSNSVSGSEFAYYNDGLISDMPATTPIISDYLSAYLQGNQNSIQARLNSTFVNGMLGAVQGSTAIASGLGGMATRTMSKSASGGQVGGGAMSLVNSTANAVLDIQSVQAQLKDISNIPPNMSSQGSNPNFDSGNRINGVYLIKKQIRSEYVNILSDFFKVYGYKVNVLKTPQFRTRESYNYIKMNTCNVVANLPNEILTDIKQIFINGCTLWHTDNMLNYNQSNDER